jgi:hypothetical protein
MSWENNVEKTVLIFAIEKSLLNIGRPLYEAVVSRLEVVHNCKLSDCDKRLGDLKQVLYDIFGNSHTRILDGIKTELGELTDQEYYSERLKALEN